MGPDGKEGLVKKPTKFYTNSCAIKKAMDKQCSCKEKHVQLMGGRAAACATYLRKLCEAACRGGFANSCCWMLMTE